MEGPNKCRRQALNEKNQRDCLTLSLRSDSKDGR